MSNEKKITTPAEIADEELKGVTGGTDEVLVDMFVITDENTGNFIYFGRCPNCGEEVTPTIIKNTRRCPHCKTAWDNIYSEKE